jgi:RNA polymerase sigma-70 factor (ECF subfamily)
MTTTEFQSNYQQLSQMLNAFAYKLTQDKERAKDLYQETTFRALTYKNKFQPWTNFKAWVFTIMKNLFINDYRKKVRANVIMDSTDNNYYINSGTNVIDNEGDSNIMMDELTEIIGNLDEGLRIPFLMHYEGYKYQEIADKFSLPIGTVKSKIFFARKELKHQIEKRYSQKFAFN